MTSAVSPAKPPPQNNAPQSAHPANTQNNAASPPSKRDLKSWWKKFQNQSKHHDAPANRPQGIFGVPLRQSITYANVAISLIDEDGKSYIYGYVPIVVAKCGVFLKEKATGIEGIFRLSGSEKRIKELKTQFDSPDRYGKGLVWDGYTVHDAANVLRRYLNDLPEPVVPLDLYEKFREPLRGQTQQAVGDAEGPQLNDDFDQSAAIEKYEQLIKDLPPLNRQLLLYLLDLLAVFAAKADENRMTSQNLAAIFQPGMLSHPSHAMAPDEYRLNQCVIIFLIENQDHFLIGMQGTAADEKTKQAIEKGTPPINSPATPNRKTGIVRSASNASAGAESVSRDGKIRRNRSTSSRHSRQSNGASTPGSPALGTSNSALGRSNTVPSKKSPGIASARFQRHGSPAIAMTPASPSPTSTGVLPPPTVSEELVQTPSDSTEPSAATGAGLGPGSNAGAGRSQERLLEPTPEIVTPSKERNLQSLFNRSPKDDQRQPNKLRKKRLPGSANPSAQSSTTSLPHSRAVSPSIEAGNPFEKRNVSHGEDTLQTSENAATADPPSDQTRKAAEVPPQPNHESSSGTLKPKESHSTSLHSSFNEGSDIDQVPEETGPSTVEHQEKEKEKKRRWRLSRRKEETAESSNTPTSPRHAGANAHEGMSATSLGSSSQKPRKSFTNDSSEAGTNIAESDAGSHRDESRGPLGWIKNKYREAKETAEQRRTKSPPAEGRGSLSSGPLPTRGKSLDVKRGGDEKEKTVVAQPAVEPPSIQNAPGESRSPDAITAAPAPAVAGGPAAAAEEKQENAAVTSTH